MEAIIVEDFGEAKVETVPDPEIGDDDVLVAVDRVQVSATECALFRGEEVMGADLIRERLADGDGRLFGHEFCGTVADTGSAVERFDTGDRVYAPGKVTCGTCSQCDAGFPSLCENYETLGTHRPGALAELVAGPSDIFRKLPDEVSDAEGAALQPLADVTLTVHDVGIATGDTVAVVGSGVMGYACGQVAQEQGAGRVLAIDVDARKVALAEKRGMVGIDAGETDPVEAVRTATDGRGADIAVEAVGGDQTDGTTGSDPLAQSFRMVRQGGTIIQMGIIGGDIALTPRRYRGKSVRWHNPKLVMEKPSPSMDIGEMAAELVASGRVGIAETVTHELSGLSAFETAVEVTLNRAEHDALGPAQLVL